MTITGCKPDPAVQKGAVVDAGVNPANTPPATEPQHPADPVPTVDAPPPGPTGNITGTVTFAGKTPTGSIDTTMDPACSLSTSGKLPIETIVAKAGKLANVFVYVKSGPPEAMGAGPVANRPVVLDQQHCQYVPHVIGVMQGGSVEFRNSDPTMHNIHTLPTDTGNQTVDISQSPRGAPQTKQFLKAELMIPVRCNNHPWMNAFINVSPTPYFAVTDAAGHFDLHGLPPGAYVLGMVQEKLGEKTMNISVTPNATVHADKLFPPS
jgi:plastocyanin